MLLVLVIPAIRLVQPGAGQGGQKGVPLDENMNLVFLLVGVAFAAFVNIRQLRQRATANQRVVV